jgi:hypothetical protein
VNVAGTRTFVEPEPADWVAGPGGPTGAPPDGGALDALPEPAAVDELEAAPDVVALALEDRVTPPDRVTLEERVTLDGTVALEETVALELCPDEPPHPATNATTATTPANQRLTA